MKTIFQKFLPAKYPWVNQLVLPIFLFIVFLFSFSYSALAQYCVIDLYSLGCTDGDDIGIVQFNTINNITSSPANCPGLNGYSDYTNISTIVSKNQTYSLTVGTSSAVYSQGFGVWIDFNQNSSFNDSGEFVYASTTSSTSPFTTTVTIPPTALSGSTRMRVRGRFANTVGSTESCTMFSYGETEDYTVIILGSAMNDAGISKIDSPSNYCPGLLNVKATVVNFGINKLDSVRVNWTFNGAPRPTIFYTSTLDTIGSSGTSQASILLGTENFIGGQSYTIKVWTSHPNGMTDTVNINDTITKPMTNLSTCPLPDDVGVTGFVSPSSFGCETSDSTQICITVKNLGLQPQSNIPVSYKIFSVVVATEIIPGPLAPGASIQYCFNKKVNLSLPDLYPFSAYTGLPGDMKTSNDTAGPYPVQSSAVRKVFPYLITFEEQSGSLPEHWSTDPNNNEEWKFDNGTSTGPSAPSLIPFDHTTGTPQGYFAYIDNDFPTSNSIIIQTQCLDFSLLPNPFMEFYHWNIDPSNSINLVIEAFDNNVWTPIAGPYAYQNSSNWGYHLISLANYAGKVIKIRFKAIEVGSATSPDMAIDDVRFFNIGPINFKALNLLSPVSACALTDIELVTFQFQQMGNQTLYPGEIIPLSFQLNNGTIVNESYTLTINDTIHQFDTLNYTFNAPSNLLNAGDYQFKIWISHPVDDDFSNDTLKTIVTNILIDQFPSKEEFTSFNLSDNAAGYKNNWASNPSNTTSLYRWNVGTGQTPSANTGPLGDHTSLDGKYLFAEANGGGTGAVAEIITPCYDLAQLTNPGLNFWYNMYGTNIGSLHLDVAIGANIYTDVMDPIIGQQGQQWKLAAVNLDNFANEVISFRIRAIRGNGTIGDIAIDDFIVGELPQVALPDTIKDCGSVRIDALVIEPNYLWTTGGTGKVEVVKGSALDTVKVKVGLLVTNAHGLSNYDTTNLVIAPGPYVNLGKDTLVCGQSSLTLDAGNPGMSHLWDNNTQTQTRTVTTSGTYSVRVSDIQGCLKADTIFVTFGPPIPVANFTYNQTSTTVVNFTNTSTNADSIIWDFGDGYYAYQNNPQHYFLTGGSFTVKLIVFNICGSDTMTQQIVVTGIESPEIFKSLDIYPNPTSGAFTLSLNTASHPDIEISVLNLQGQVIFNKEYLRIKNEFRETLNIPNLSRGVYFIKIKSGQDFEVRRLIVQ